MLRAGVHSQLSLEQGMPACRNSGGETALRRVVCSIGTTGSTSGHNLVHRSMQALFREVGLTPNFVWDSDYAVPSMYLPYDQKRALEEARLDNTVEQIKRVQRGTPAVLWHARPCLCCAKLPGSGTPPPPPPASGARAERAGVRAGEKAQESATLKMMDPSDTAAARPPEAEVLASQLRGDEVDELAAAPPESESDVEVSSLEVQESIQKIAVELDEAVRTLAMSPWMMVASEARRLEEQKTLAELQVFVSGLLPKLMLAVAKVQEGERDADKLTEFVSEDPDDEGFAAAAVQQLLQCHGALERAAGAPDAEAPKTRHAMVRTIKRVKCVQEWNEARMRGGR